MVARILALGLSVVALAVPSVATQAVVELAGLATASGRPVANAVVWLDAAGSRASREPKAVAYRRTPARAARIWRAFPWPMGRTL